MTEQERLDGLIYKTLKQDEITAYISSQAYITDILSEAIIRAGYKSPSEIMEMFKGYEDTIKLLREQLAHARDGYMKLADLTREQRYNIWKQVETNGK